MPLFSWNSTQQDRSTPRWFAGISITSNCRRIESALIGVHGRGSGAPVEIRKSISFDLPREVIDCYHELREAVCPNAGASIPSIPSSLFHHVRRELASVEEEAIDELVAESKLAKNAVLAVGIHEPGFLSGTPSGTHYISLCDAAFLAEQTGMNIIDGFSLQDVAAGGRGGPIFPMPTWIFLKSELQDRILLDLGRTATLTFLPQADSPFAPQRIAQRDIVPCGSLLDSLAWELTGGKVSVDVGGRLTVQGCLVPELLLELRLATSLPESWNPFGISAEPYLKTILGSDNTDRSYQDVLCTASDFIAETVAENLLALMAEHGKENEPEILVSGSCRMHGMLLNRISTLLQNRPLLPLSQFDIPSETLDALCTAMLALMATDRIPASLPHLTGGASTKTLGRITPGSMGNWTKLLQEMAETKPASRPLRSAQ